MAMNKKEKAAFDDLKRQLALAKAMRFTGPVEPDIEPPRSHSDGIVNGWIFSAYFDPFRGPSIEKGCTSSRSHGTLQWGRVDTQHPRWLFSTRLLALQAMRHAVEQKVAAILANIDEQIEREIANPNTEVPNAD